MAAGVIRDPVRVIRADVGQTKPFGQERGELPDAGQNCCNFIDDARMVSGSLQTRCHGGIVLAHHGDAAGGRHDHGFSMPELLDKPGQKGHGVLLVAGVVVHLSAAGLAGRKVDRVAQPFKDTNDGLPRFGEERVVIAGNK